MMHGTMNVKINVWVLYANVKKATKIKIAETIIFPTVTYGSESWTVRKKKRKKN
jgi:hypothetical protein